MGQPLAKPPPAPVCGKNGELPDSIAVIGRIGVRKLDDMSRRRLIKLGDELGLSLKRSLMGLRVDVLEPDVKKHARGEHRHHRAKQKSENQAEPK